MPELHTTPGPETRLGSLSADPFIGTVKDLEFLFKVAMAAYSVRAIQREYFKTRDLSLLNQSKVAERELDQLLKEPAQGGLFNE